MTRGRRPPYTSPPKTPIIVAVDAIEVRVVRLRPGSRLPSRAYSGATGFDLHACLEAALVLGQAPAKVPTGLAIEFPAGCDVQIRPRSGLTAKSVGVGFGTIDADYRGELFVTMWTFGGLDRYELRDGDRIAQLVVARLAPALLVEAEYLSATERGGSGHGSTGR
jgi:dUTP pyrophosphatase